MYLFEHISKRLRTLEPVSDRNPHCPLPAPRTAAGSPGIVLGTDAALKLKAVPGHILGQLVDHGLNVGGRRDDGSHGSKGTADKMTITSQVNHLGDTGVRPKHT